MRSVIIYNREYSMKLKRQPETEEEYYETIWELGGVAVSLALCLDEEEFENPQGEISKEMQDILDIGEIQKTLFLELKEKFGIIPPEEYSTKNEGKTPPLAPEGKIYYHDWWEKMRRWAEEDKVLQNH